MTKKEFKKALLRGHGRCVLAVRENPVKYRDLVMWACGQQIAFDAQCEGSRAWYIYNLVCCYSDQTPFIKAAADSLKASRSDGGWKIFCLSELLSFFAMDGNRIAIAALERKYRQLYDELMARKRRKSGVFHQLDDFSNLCVVMAMNKKLYLRIAGDIGRLYREKPIYDGWDFEWLYDCKKGRYLSALKKAAKTSEDIAYYLEIQQEREKEDTERGIDRTASDLKGVALSRWLERKADEEIVLRYVHDYLSQEEPEKRANALSVFFVCPFPLDPSPIIKDTESSSKELQNAAWRALEKIRHPLVRKFALSQIDTADLSSVVSLIAKNYQPEDAGLLERLVKSVPIEHDSSSGWHGVHGAVLGMKDDGIKAPPSLLYYIYETTRCSCCRESALAQMGKRRLLTDEILRECLYDSNDEIRIYAKRRSKQRNSK